MEQRIAVIDLGTNTFNLLLAEMWHNDYKIFYSDKVPVKIGQGGINKGIITAEAQERALDAMQFFEQKIKKENIQKIYAFATSAFRNARNGYTVKDKIKSLTGINVDIIDGDLEAFYIYQGVKGALEIGEEPSLILDIGGGSVEFIIGDSDKIFWKNSFEIGAQRLLDRFHKVDPIAEEDVSALLDYLVDELKPLDSAMRKFDIDTLIGSSGTFDTLSEIYCASIDIPFDPILPEFPLDHDFYMSIHQQLLQKNKAQRLSIPGMLPMRVDMIVVASCLIYFVVNRYKIANLRVSSHSLKEGMLDKIQSEIFSSENILTD